MEPRLALNFHYSNFVFWVLDTMMDFQMTTHICKTPAPVDLPQNWSFFTPPPTPPAPIHGLRWRFLPFRTDGSFSGHDGGGGWARGLSSWRASPAPLRKASRKWAWPLNSLLLLLGFPFGLGWTAPDSRPNNLSFPLVFLQPSPLVYTLAAPADGVRWKRLTDRHRWLLVPPVYHELSSNGTTQREIQQSSCLIPTNRSFHPLQQELRLLQMPLLLYPCRLLTKGTNAFCISPGILWLSCLM